MRNMNMEQREEFAAWLTAPFDARSARKPSPFTEAQEAESFMGLMAAVGSKQAV